MRVFTKTKNGSCFGTGRLSVKAITIVFGLMFCSSCVFCSAVIADQESSPVSVSAATVASDAETESTAPFDAEAPFMSQARLFPAHLTKDDVVRRPMLYFRMWANKPLPPVRSFLFLLFIAVVASELMPRRMEIASRYYADHFWKSLWTGILACLLFTTLARTLYASEIAVPLAVVSLAALQFFLLIGASISSTLIGQTILSVLKLQRPPLGSRWFHRLAAPLVGCSLLSLLLLIPPLGILPRVGVRLIMLLSFLGMGAWFRTGMGTKELDSASEM